MDRFSNDEWTNYLDDKYNEALEVIQEIEEDRQ